jgi:hypothetical protein
MNEVIRECTAIHDNILITKAHRGTVSTAFLENCFLSPGVDMRLEV